VFEIIFVLILKQNVNIGLCYKRSYSFNDPNPDILRYNFEVVLQSVVMQSSVVNGCHCDV